MEEKTSTSLEEKNFHFLVGKKIRPSRETYFSTLFSPRRVIMHLIEEKTSTHVRNGFRLGKEIKLLFREVIHASSSHHSVEEDVSFFSRYHFE